MTTAHTQGRITFLEDGDANHYSMLTEGGRWWLSLLMNGEQTTARQIANLRRLAACWNVCEGISTESLELMPGQFFKPPYERLKAVEAQRDELLAALKLAVTQNEHDMLMTGEELRSARAVIEKSTPPAGQ